MTSKHKKNMRRASNYKVLNNNEHSDCVDSIRLEIGKIYINT